MRYFRIAKDRDGYSDAYWEVRNIWLQNNLVTILLILVIITALWELAKFMQKTQVFNPVIAPVRSHKKGP